jgi:hypothetical protein
MPLYDFFADGKSHTGAFVLTTAVKPLEGDKNPVQVLLVETSAVIGYESHP